MRATTLSTTPIVATGPAQSIADFKQIKPMHPFLRMTEKPKQAYGYKVPAFYPKVTRAIGSELYTNVGLNRAQGACRFNPATYKQPSQFRDKNIRLQFPHLQRDEATTIQVPPRMYGEYSQRFSSAIAL